LNLKYQLTIFIKFFFHHPRSSTAATSSGVKTPTTKVEFDFPANNGHSSTEGGGGSLHRHRKPHPLTGLPVAVNDDLLTAGYQYLNQLKPPPRTPRTPLLPSPDALAIEERFRSLIDAVGGGNNAGGSGDGGQTELDRLRNLSVSSADFNFGGGGDGGGSLPGTPSFRPQFFHIPGRNFLLSIIGRDTPDTDFAGYPAKTKAGYRISGKGRIPYFRPDTWVDKHILVKYQINL
jgi:hypothetical protein